jgi:transposase-like protein
MKEEIKNQYVKRSQKDYSMSFKLQVVQEVEQGEIGLMEAHKRYGIQGSHTVKQWLQKFGTFDWENQTPSNMPKSQDRKLMELEQKIRLLEKQKAFLEKQVRNADEKAILFDMIIDMAEKEFKIPIRKKSIPEQSTDTTRSESNQ